MKISIQFKHFISLLTICCLTLNLHGQGWEYTFGESGYDNGGNIALTNDGGYIIAGTHTQTDSSNADILLLKLDQNGETEWTKTFGGTKTDWTSSVLPTSDGGYLIGGSTRSFSSNEAVDFWVIKTDASGNIEWDNLILVAPENDLVAKVIPANDGGYIVIGTTANIEPTWNKAKIIKIAENGNIVWTQIYQAPNYHMSPTDIIALNDGSGYAFCGSQDYKAFITKTDNFGNVVFNQEYIIPNNDIIRAYTLIQTEDGGFLSAIDGDYWDNLGDQKIFIIKTNSSGTLEWFGDFGGDGDENVRDVARSANGNYCFFGTSTSVGNNYYQSWLMEIDINGNVVWERHHGGIQQEYAYDIDLDHDNGFVAIGSTKSYGAGGFDVYYFKTDSLGHIFSNYIEGNVFEDLNSDCSFNTDETTLQNWLVRFTGTNTYETLTDENGFYKQNVAPGDYVITIHPPNNYWETNCFESIEYSFTAPYDFLSLDIPVNERVDCPYLEVDIATSFVRICTHPKYYVNYCNTGSATAEDTYIEVLMDPYIQVDSASIPISSQSGDLLTFELGDVAQSDCGDFIIYTRVDCDTSIIGYTHCVEANIFPDSLCLNPDVLLWNGATLKVSGVCETDSIRFYIENEGPTATSSARQYIVIEDDVMYLDGSVNLNPAEIFEIAVPANGSTFRLEAEQEIGHPGNSMPSTVIQACGVDSFGISSDGFVNIFAFNEGNASTSIICTPNVYPFDPNDKQGFPNGYREEHFIDKGQELEYLIRFQNTGNAEAFAVSVVDTLSPLLDMARVRPGSSSHPYEFEILEGNVVRFTFIDINLPDSTTNFEASQGFVQFKIDQKNSTNIGDVIYNSADIYFDFATPVKTNQTWHTIGENYLEMTVHNEEIYIHNVNVNVFPNPFSRTANFEIHGEEITSGRFELFDAAGRQVYSKTFEDSLFLITPENLGPGIYFYTIQNNHRLLSSGKLIAQ